MKLVRGYARVPFPAAAMTPILIFFNVKGKSLKWTRGSIRKGSFPSVELQTRLGTISLEGLPNPLRRIPGLFWVFATKSIQMEAPNAFCRDLRCIKTNGHRIPGVMVQNIGHRHIFPSSKQRLRKHERAWSKRSQPKFQVVAIKPPEEGHFFPPSLCGSDLAGFWDKNEVLAIPGHFSYK